MMFRAASPVLRSHDQRCAPHYSPSETCERSNGSVPLSQGVVDWLMHI